MPKPYLDQAQTVGIVSVRVTTPVRDYCLRRELHAGLLTGLDTKDGF
jgi:hypothetical protein